MPRVTTMASCPGTTRVEHGGSRGVAVHAIEARAGGKRRGVPGEGGDGVAAPEEGVADGAAGTAGGADDEDVHGVLPSLVIPLWSQHSRMIYRQKYAFLDRSSGGLHDRHAVGQRGRTDRRPLSGAHARRVLLVDRGVGRVLRGDAAVPRHPELPHRRARHRVPRGRRRRDGPAGCRAGSRWCRGGSATASRRHPALRSWAAPTCCPRPCWAMPSRSCGSDPRRASRRWRCCAASWPSTRRPSTTCSPCCRRS